ncbi:ADP-ribose pyrophosphatase [Desulfocicer vacuolatum DSM 3385]|uniref:ADP-ribose pyrophosphatase n=1 Tax=Desulfocicer vacuolatum DSM 3385 TaxID=1121400 RepID=A0A1W2AEJ8_9BACT|nr:NUDIX hydrolase [Desulfocicer vacuolatum]SMC58881.1 ADP-ribose pyrophosphatase [Desulfocicer vacuolatum DSM 3385]
MQIKNIEKITEQTHLNLFSISYVDQRSHEKSWVFASRKKVPEVADNNFPLADAVVIVPFHREEKKLVMIREFWVPLGGFQYGFPAGLVDPGETIEMAAARELKEETGFALKTVLRTSPPIYSSSGMTDESVSLVFAACDGKESLEGNEDSEEISVLLLSREDAKGLLNTPELKFDVKSWIILEHFVKTGTI